MSVSSRTLARLFVRSSIRSLPICVVTHCTYRVFFLLSIISPAASLPRQLVRSFSQSQLLATSYAMFSFKTEYVSTIENCSIDRSIHFSWHSTFFLGFISVSFFEYLSFVVSPSISRCMCMCLCWSRVRFFLSCYSKLFVCFFYLAFNCFQQINSISYY